MLSIENIKKLQEKTNDIEVLKSAFGIESSNVKYIIGIYERLEKEELNIPQRYKDLLALCYINERLTHDRIAIEKLIYDNNFIAKISSMSIDELKQYIAYCSADSYNDILTNQSTIKLYSTKDHLELIKVAEDIKDASPEMKAIFRTALNMQTDLATIRTIIKTLKNILTEENKGLFAGLLTKNSMYQKYNGIELIEIIIAISQLNKDPNAEELANLALAGYWRGVGVDRKFNDVVKFVALASEETLEIFHMKQLFDLNNEDITKIINLTNEHPHLVKLFSDELLGKHLSYPERCELVKNFELDNEDNFDAFENIIAGLDLENVSDEFYTELITILNKDLCYQTTVKDYLELCGSIEEFLSTIEGKFANDDYINLATTLKLSPKEEDNQ